ncbi:OLC1v1032664C1 [Oldenlandia corymbosa var. corymbosa]|uniref:OLC1v1032664C1 n=1 Tax=Oldenlandia corymbosa var. corymbosa TaxID=529605 RepID=A0AAV1CM48_OLDCO|nr:OLC1v1032664C1 [Oldenlandia corymbosa var. corymbosa]
MNRTGTSLLLDFLLKELDGWCNSSHLSDSEDDIRGTVDICKVELRFLRTFLVYVKNWDGAGHLGSLVSDIKAGFKELRRDFRAASKKGIDRSRVHLEAAISKLQEKSTLRRPQIRAAYGLVQDFGLKQSKVRYILTQFGAALVHAAHLSFRCWVNMDDIDENMMKMLSNLLKKFKPNTPQVIEGCLDALLVFNETTGLERLGRFLIPEKNQVEILNQGLGFLNGLDESRNKIPFNLLGDFMPNTIIEGYLDVLRPADKALDFTKQLELFCRIPFFSNEYQVDSLNKGLEHLVLFVFY